MYVHDTAPNGRALISVPLGNSRMVGLVPGAERDRVLSWFDWSTVADLSADGERLLFFEWGAAMGGVPTVYVRPTDGGDAVRLGEGRPLALSPDEQVALVSRDSPARLVLLPLGAGQERELDNTGVVAYSTARWFPDGERILFTGEGADGVFRTYYQEVDGGPAEPAPVLGVLAALISPSGDRVAGYGLDGERYVCDTEGEECLPIEGSVPGDRLLEWSDDGAALFVVAVSDNTLEIYRLELETGTRRPWRTIAPVDAAGMLGFELEGVRITPDGRYHAYSYWRSLDTLFVVDGLG